MHNSLTQINIIISILAFSLLSGCGSKATHPPQETVINPPTEVRNDGPRFIRNNSLKLTFNSSSDIALTDQHVSQIIKWQSTWYDSFDGVPGVIVLLQGTISTTTTMQTANQRMKAIESIVDGVLGIDSENIPVVPVAFDYTFEGPEDHYVLITPRMLLE